MPQNDGLDSLVADPQFQSLPPADQRRALAGVSGDDSFSKLSDPDTLRYVTAHKEALGPQLPAMPLKIPQTDTGIGSLPPMQGSSAPNYVRGATASLPVAGGLAGGVLGAPTVGGAVIGAGLGAAGGEQAKMLINRKVFGPDETNPLSKEGLTNTGVAGTIGAASEVPGAVMQGYGSVLLKRLAASQTAKQTGDAIEAFKSVAPKGLSAEGLAKGLTQAKSALSDQLTNVFSKATAGSTSPYVAVDQLLSPVQHQAAVADQAFAAGRNVTQSKRVFNAVNDAITSAKLEVGIKNNSATLQQLSDMQHVLQRKAFATGQLGPGAPATAKNILQDAYRTIGSEIDRQAPEARQLLDKQKDIYAALDALHEYKPGTIKSLALSSATNLRATALISPVATPAMIAAGAKAKQTVDTTLSALKGIL